MSVQKIAHEKVRYMKIIFHFIRIFIKVYNFYDLYIIPINRQSIFILICYDSRDELEQHLQYNKMRTTERKAKNYWCHPYVIAYCFLLMRLTFILFKVVCSIKQDSEWNNWCHICLQQFFFGDCQNDTNGSVKWPTR